MIVQPRKSIIASLNDDVKVVYNLIFQNAYYSLECYKEGSSKHNIKDYCFVEYFTDDEGEAESFVHRLVKGKVFPVHIKDLVEDLFK